jgi:HK97 family phage portal protein
MQRTVSSAVAAVRGWLATRTNLHAGSYHVLNQIISGAGREQLPLWPDLSDVQNQIRLYTQQPLVHIAVSKIARAGAMVELDVYALRGGQKRAIPNHPIEQLLRRPNRRQSRFQLMETTIGFLQLTGNAYWYLASDSGGPPDQIYILRPDRVRIKPGVSAEQPIAAYVYTVNNVDIPLDPDQVIHFKRFHPGSDLYGLSPIEAAALEIQGDSAMARWNTAYFGKEMAIPAGVVSIKNTISDGDFESIQKQWQQSYGGTRRKTAFIRGADVTFQPIGTNHQEMDFGAGRQFNKELVMLVWGIPPGILDKNATEANALAGYEVFTRDTLYPAMVEIADTLTLALAPFYADHLVIEARDIRTKDGTNTLREIEAFAPFMEINEIRRQYLNLPAVPWGDRPAVGAASDDPYRAAFERSRMDGPEQQAIGQGRHDAPPLLSAPERDPADAGESAIDPAA